MPARQRDCGFLGWLGTTAGGWVAAAVVSLPAPAAGTEALRAAPADSVVGSVELYEARYEDSLLDVARRFGLGIDELRLANPDVSLWLPGEGTPIRLPSRFVLPSSVRRGVVINVPEMRLYYYSNDGNAVHTWPISIGRVGYETPLGKTRVARKKVAPTWYPTESIREEHAARGEPLPRVVHPGPDNPLGSHAIYLGFPTYLIHGTNRPFSIGMRVSHGCVRLYPEHIEELYNLVVPGTPVAIVHQRVKTGWFGNELFLEVHPNRDVPELDALPSMTDAVRSIIRATPEEGERPSIDWRLVEQALATSDGIPVAVGRRAGGSNLADERPPVPAGASPTSS
ncbi:MAG: L,D-transpeptidase family protein [Immundisolibacterales bacterium]|nr:L,D-transpeptidase family protein [Immundisolibacterales bacterium]